MEITPFIYIGSLCKQGPMENFQKNMLNRYGSKKTSLTYTRFGSSDKSVLHALVQCLNISDVWAYVKSLRFIVNIALLVPFSRKFREL